jgi:Mn-dependent DtxR family transcriptional regulator
MGQKGCLEYLQNNGEAGTTTIAEEQNISNTSVKKNMERLQVKGLVEVDKSQKPHLYSLTEEGEEEDPEKHGGMVV